MTSNRATTSGTVLTPRRGASPHRGRLALIAAPASASAKEKYKIGFEKDCPELTCTGTLLKRPGADPGQPVATTLTPLWFESGVLGYSARGDDLARRLGIHHGPRRHRRLQRRARRDRRSRQRRQRLVARSPADRRARAGIRRAGRRHHFRGPPRDHTAGVADSIPSRRRPRPTTTTLPDPRHTEYQNVVRRAAPALAAAARCRRTLPPRGAAAARCHRRARPADQGWLRGAFIDL